MVVVDVPSSVFLNSSNFLAFIFQNIISKRVMTFHLAFILQEIITKRLEISEAENILIDLLINN